MTECISIDDVTNCSELDSNMDAISAIEGVRGSRVIVSKKLSDIREFDKENDQISIEDQKEIDEVDLERIQKIMDRQLKIDEPEEALGFAPQAKFKYQSDEDIMKQKLKNMQKCAETQRLEAMN